MPRLAIVPLIVACALFMENIDSTVITTSLPAIAVDLGVDPLSLKLALTSYLLSLAVFIPISGWMADRYGARTVFRAAIIVFTLGSAACGFAQSLPDFVLYRVVQGMGGAMMVPVGRLVILRAIPKHELVSALAWLTMPALLGPVIGPPLGGFITTYVDWRWIFWINIPIGLVGIALASRYIENVREQNVPPLDKRGFVLSGIGLSGIAFGLTTFGQGLLHPAIAASLLVVGALATFAYMRHARRTRAPMLDLKLLAIPTFFASVVGGSLFRLGIGAMAFMLPLLFQIGFGLTPFQSGMLTFSAAIGAITMRATAAPILYRIGFKRVVVANAVIASLFIGIAALFTPQTPYWLIVVVLLWGGFFRSLQFTSVNTLAYADVETRIMSQATSIASVAQQLALSTGVAVAALALEAARALRGDAAVIAADFTPAFIFAGAVAMVSVLFFVRLPKDAGASLTTPARKGALPGEPDPQV
jgi:EmrB/QacA subfamily drug resistance transporter